MSEPNIISRKLRKHRIQNDWKQDKTAERLNVTQSAIAKYESGTRTPDLFTLVNFMKVYKTDLTDFITKYGINEDEEFFFFILTTDSAMNDISFANGYKEWKASLLFFKKCINLVYFIYDKAGVRSSDDLEQIDEKINIFASSINADEEKRIVKDLHFSEEDYSKLKNILLNEKDPYGLEVWDRFFNVLNIREILMLFSKSYKENGIVEAACNNIGVFMFTFLLDFFHHRKNYMT